MLVLPAKLIVPEFIVQWEIDFWFRKNRRLWRVTVWV